MGNMKPLYKLIIILLLLVCPAYAAYAGDYFDWSVRTDRDGKPAGIFTATPFPVVETDSTYSITDDEGTTTYTLGTIYFVDNAGTGCGNGSTNYDPATRACGLGAYTVYTTINNGLSAVSAGNKTILVRAGTYTSNTVLYMKDGINNTHRYSVIGYNQERPIIDFNNQTSGSYGISHQGYAALQRLEIKNTYDAGVRFLDTYGNAIDIYIHDIKSNAGSGAFHGEGTVASNAWMYHCTVSRTVNHGIKVSDNQDNTIFEWGVIEYAGFWSPEGDMQINEWHALAADFVSHESTIGTYIGTGNIFRYNIVHDGYSWLMNIEHQETFSIHHNEFYNAYRVYDSTAYPKAGCNGTCATPTAWVNDATSGAYTVDFNESSNGSFYSNVVRDKAGTAEGTNDHGHIQLHGATTEIIIGNINIYNNLIYQSDTTNTEQLLEVGSNLAAGQAVNIYNNTFYGDTAGSPDRLLDDKWTGITTVANNIFYQAGTGTAAGGTFTHTHNLYYYPNGSAGITVDGTGEIDAANPLFTQIPSGTYDSNDALPQSNSSMINTGSDLSGVFTSVFQNTSTTRSAWDIGAYEYIAPPPTLKSDFNSDSKVNGLDFTLFKNAFKGFFNSLFDLNSDSAIDVKDLGVLMSGWLP